jgi:hypothetical protein
MRTIAPSPLLRRILMINALSWASVGLILFGLGSFLEGMLGLSSGVAQPIGFGLVCVAGLVGLIEVQPTVPIAAIRAMAVCNVVWFVVTLAALLTGWVEPSRSGVGFIVAQALWLVLVAEAALVALSRGRYSAA